MSRIEALKNHMRDENTRLGWWVGDFKKIWPVFVVYFAWCVGWAVILFAANEVLR